MTCREAKGEVVWEIILSTWRADVDYRRPRNVIVRPDRYYCCPLEPAGPDATLGEAVEKQLLKETSFRREDLPDRSGVYEVDGRPVRIVDLRGEAQEQGVREFATGYPAFREALKLVMNGVCNRGRPVIGDAPYLLYFSSSCSQDVRRREAPCRREPLATHEAESNGGGGDAELCRHHGHRKPQPTDGEMADDGARLRHEAPPTPGREFDRC